MGGAMTRKLKVIFYILLILYVMLIIANWWAFISITHNFGIKEGLELTNFFYEIAIIFFAYFVYKKDYRVLPLIILLHIYWLLTMPIFYIDEYGIRAFLLMFDYIGFNQMFLLNFSSWFIPIVALIGVVFYIYDRHDLIKGS